MTGRSANLPRARVSDQKERIHARFAKIFRDYQGRFDQGAWQVEFAGRTVRVPLSKARAWLRWDLALSIAGHEPEIKQTYETILGVGPRQTDGGISRQSPVQRVFIAANVG